MRGGRTRIIAAVCATVFIGSAIGFGISLDLSAGHTAPRGETLFLAPSRHPQSQPAETESPLDRAVAAALASPHRTARQVRMNVTLSTSGANETRLTVVATVQLAPGDPILADFVNGSLVAEGDTDSVFGSVEVDGAPEPWSNPDAESVIINSLSPPAVTREQVWTLDTDGLAEDGGLLEFGWTSADEAMSENGLDINTAVPDPVTVAFHIADTRLVAYDGGALPQISGSDISLTRSGPASADLLLASSSSNDQDIDVTQWPCGKLTLGQCFEDSGDQDTSLDDATDPYVYAPSSAVQVFELALTFAATCPLVLALGRRRPWTYRPRREWLALVTGAVLVVAATVSADVVAIVPGGVLPFFQYLVGMFVGLSLAAVIALYIAYGTVEWVRWTLTAIGVAVALGDVAYLYAAYRITGRETFFIAGIAVSTAVVAHVIRRDLKTTVGVCALAVAFTLEFAQWVKVRPIAQIWFARLPFTFINLQATWVPISVGLASAAMLDAYLRRSGLRRRRLLRALYPLAALVTLVPGVVLHPNADHSRDLYSTPFDYWLSWWAALSVFTACAVIRLAVVGRTAEGYRRPETKRLAVAAAAIICMMLFYNSNQNQYESGAVALVAVASLWIALPTRDVGRAVELAGSTAPSHAQTTARYARARVLFSARNQLRRNETDRLAGGELTVADFDTRSEELLDAINSNGGVSASVRERVFGALVDESPAHAGAVGALIALLCSAPIVAFDVTNLPERFISDLTQVPLITSLWQAVALEHWVFYGFLFGYFYPLLRGRSPMAKAWLLAVALTPTELTLAWISNYHVRPETIAFAVGETVAFFLVVGVVWEVRLVVRSSIPWTEVRNIRGARGVLAPLGALALAAVTAAVPVLFPRTSSTNSPQNGQPQAQLQAHGSSPANPPSATPLSALPSGVAWATGAETQLPCFPPNPVAPAAATAASPTATCAPTQSPAAP